MPGGRRVRPGSPRNLRRHQCKRCSGSPLLPLFFLINCIYIGYSIAILESVISSYAFQRPYEIRQLSGLAGIIP